MRSAFAASVALIAAITIVVAGCGSGDDTASTVTETVTDEAAPPSTTTAPSKPETPTDGAPPPADVQADGVTGFTSPTGNIGCYIDAKSVRCDIGKRDWEPPPRPGSCNDNVDYGQGIQLSAGAAAEFVCAGDTALGGGEPLPYGRSIAAGLLRCESAESGMTCTDTETGRGFTLAIGSYDIF